CASSRSRSPAPRAGTTGRVASVPGPTTGPTSAASTAFTWRASSAAEVRRAAVAQCRGAVTGHGRCAKARRNPEVPLPTPDAERLASWSDHLAARFARPRLTGAQLRPGLPHSIGSVGRGHELLAD